MKLAKWKQEWWNNVKMCLIKFHKKTPRQAAAHVREWKKKLITPKIGVILYHEEPFRLAENITRTKIDLSTINYKQDYIEGILFAEGYHGDD